MPIARLSVVALDCADPRSLAEFYRGITGGEVVTYPEEDDWVLLRTGVGVDIGFQTDPDHQAPGWPDGSPQQAHLDFEVDDLNRAEQEAVAVGARKTATQPEPDRWRVFLDPAGHPFCLVKA